MKRAAEVKPSVRCSEEPGAGDGSMCAVSITKRAKIEEPEAADGITRRSPAADGAMCGVGTTAKRPRKPEEPPKMNKEENNKRSKEEPPKKNKRSKEEDKHKVDKLKDLFSEEANEQLMAELAELAEKSKKKKLVTLEANQAEIESHLSYEVRRYMFPVSMFTFEDCFIHEMEMSCDVTTQDMLYTSRMRQIENQASLLRQYRTNGRAVLQYAVTDDDERDDVEGV